VTGGFAALAAE